jgi:hypothetical protein
MKRAMLENFKKVKNRIGKENEKMYHSLFTVCYLLSKNPTHTTWTEEFTGDGYADNIFYPKKESKSRTAIIH